jgi:hypothetical protein
MTTRSALKGRVSRNQLSTALGPQAASVASLSGCYASWRGGRRRLLPGATSLGSASLLSLAAVAVTGRRLPLWWMTVLGGARTIALVSAGEIELGVNAVFPGGWPVVATGFAATVPRTCFAGNGCSDGAPSGSVRRPGGAYEIRGGGGADRVPGGRRELMSGRGERRLASWSSRPAAHGLRAELGGQVLAGNAPDRARRARDGRR